MPNANWSNPTTSSNYINFVSEVKNRDEDLALQFDGTTSTNLVTGTIRWNSTLNRWQKWTGTAWGELAATYALTTITATGSITGTALIPSGNAVPTNGLYLPISNTVGIATNSTLRFQIGSTGSVTHYATSDSAYNLVGDGSSTGYTASSYAANIADRATFNFFSARGSFASPSTLFSGDILGTLRFRGQTGSGPSLGCEISGVADGTVSSGVMPGALLFRVANTSGLLTERLRITSDGQINAGGATQNTSTGRINARNTAKAYVNFDGNVTSNLRTSFNVTSITDLGGVGLYQINFTTALPDANYAAVGTVSTDGGTPCVVNIRDFVGAPSGQNPTTSALQISVSTVAGALADRTTINVVVYD